MKRLILLAALFCSLEAFAQGPYNGNVHFRRTVVEPASFAVELVADTADTNTAFILKIDNPTRKKINIWIRHSQQGTALDTTINTGYYSCRYHFDHADDGKYIITVGSGKEKITREVQLNTVMVVNRNITVL